MKQFFARLHSSACCKRSSMTFVWPQARKWLRPEIAFTQKHAAAYANRRASASTWTRARERKCSFSSLCVCVQQQLTAGVLRAFWHLRPRIAFFFHCFRQLQKILRVAFFVLFFVCNGCFCKRRRTKTACRWFTIINGWRARAHVAAFLRLYTPISLKRCASLPR